MKIIYKIKEWIWNKQQPNFPYSPELPRPMNKYDEDFRSPLIGKTVGA